VKTAKSSIHHATGTLLAAAWIIAQSSIGGFPSTPTVEGIPPVQQEAVSPIEGGGSPKGIGVTGVTGMIEAPRPGVPLDDRTFRELKERATGRR
jgi:hypothetical protein